MRLSPFNEPYTLFLEKTGQLENEDVQNDAMFWGSLLEEPVAKAYSEKTGRNVQRNNRSIRHKKHDFMIAHIDRKVVGESRGLECKTSGFGIGWGQSGTNDIPPYVYAQVQHYIEVLGYECWDVACLVGGNDLRIYEIGRDDDFISRLIDAEQEFWDRVEAKVPPEPTWEHGALVETMKAMFPGTNGSIVQLPEVAQKYADVLADAKEQAKIYEQIIEGCKNRLQMLQGSASVAILPDGTCFTRKTVERKAYEVQASEYLSWSHSKKLPKAAQDALESGSVIVIENASQPALEVKHD